MTVTLCVLQLELIISFHLFIATEKVQLSTVNVLTVFSSELNLTIQFEQATYTNSGEIAELYTVLVSNNYLLL